MSALHRFLVDFDVAPAARSRTAWSLPVPDPAHFAMGPGEGIDPFDFGGDEPGGAPSPADLAVVSEDRIAEAVAAALADAEALPAAALAAAAEQHAADLAEARLRWVADEGQVLATGFKAAVAALEEALAEGAGTVLEPLIGETLRVAAVAELRQAIGDLVLSGTGGRIAVTGPEDLLDAVRAALAGAGTDSGGLDFSAAETAEVTITCDTSTIETRLGAWGRTLQRRLGDPS